MKPNIAWRNGEIGGYRIAINKAEAEALGIIDADGNPLEIVKEIDKANKRMIIRRNYDDHARVAVPSGFLYKAMDDLLAGKHIKTERNVHYTFSNGVLYKQQHQSYLRGEQPVPYAELLGGVFYYTNKSEEEE